VIAEVETTHGTVQRDLRAGEAGERHQDKHFTWRTRSLRCGRSAEPQAARLAPLNPTNP
jgi:hypothetical protein